MASESDLFVGIGSVISTAVSVMFAISAFLRYREKRNRLTKLIFYAFSAAALSIIFICVAFVILVEHIDLGAFGLILYIDYFCLIIGSYYLFIFSQIVFLGEHEHTRLEKLVIFMTIGCIVLGVLRCYVPTPPVTAVRVVWMLVYTGLIAGPIFIGALKARSRTPKDDPHRSNLLYIAALAIAYVAGIAFFLADTILIIFLQWENPTIVVLAGEICIILMIYCTQRGLFSTSKPDQVRATE